MRIFKILTKNTIYVMIYEGVFIDLLGYVRMVDKRMKHRNIAILMTALDSDAQADTLKGIEEYAKLNNCNLAVFVWFTGAFEKDKHNSGEVNIIYLPDLNLFDGVIVFANALHLEVNRKRIVELLEGLSCPVVTIGCAIGENPQICTDNYSAMKELVNHYIIEHKMKRIHFVKGIEGNEDAEARFQAYVDALTENNIPVISERISQGDFYVTGGERAAKEILSSSLQFPEAIVCANDIMAITICDILMEKGYRVPEDVVISGYDYSLEGLYHVPRITTVRCRFEQMGEKACKILLDKMEGKEVLQKTLLPDEIILDESCGCQSKLLKENDRHKQYAKSDIMQRISIHHMISLEKNLIEGTTLEHWSESVSEFISQINPAEFYCCVNENFVEDVFESGGMEQENMDEEERLAYSEVVNVVLAYQNGVFKKKASFEAKYALDDMFKDSESGKLYIFSPLHYQDRNFGYFVFVDNHFPIGNQLYVNWLISMGNHVENLRKRCMLQTAMTRLDDMYVRDSLTGAYNRFGMDRFFAELKMKCLMSHSSMYISFIDIDGLKRINDEFGHEEGDRIISATADILKKKAKKSYVIRYGGDEFIVMGITNNEKEIKNYWNAVDAEIEQYNQKPGNKAKLSFSYGYDVFKVEASTYLEECIRVTDSKMYQNKNEKKQVKE